MTQGKLIAWHRESTEMDRESSLHGQWKASCVTHMHGMLYDMGN